MISRRTRTALAIFASLSITAAFGPGCSHNKPAAEATDNTAASTENAMKDELGSSDDGKAMGLQTVHFAFDSFSLDAPSKDALKSDADILKSHSSVKVQVEGHTDARGGVQYNIALGEKRANAVRGYLIDMGINGSRITTVSFGKERPIDPGSSEAAWSKNRRANFVITSTH